MRLEDIKPGLMVHALGEGSMGGARGVHVGTVLDVSDQSGPEGHIAIEEESVAPGEGRVRRWIPIEWIDHTDDLAVYLNKTPEELRAQS